MIDETGPRPGPSFEPSFLSCPGPQVRVRILARIALLLESCVEQNSSTGVFEFLEKSFSNFAVLEDRNGPIRSKRSGTTARISCTFA